MGTVSAIADAIASVFKWMTGRGAVKNAANIQAAKQGQSDANVIAKTNNAIERKDTDEIRKELAE